MNETNLIQPATVKANKNPRNKKMTRGDARQERRPGQSCLRR